MNIKSQTKLFCVESGYSLTYDAENRLTGASGTAMATFVYDGDGNRVKGTVGGVTTAYIGNHLEWTGSTSTMKRYYYAGATRVAIRTGSSTLNYLLGDHLGSTSITTNSSGVRVAEERYMPWGESRYTYGSTPTTYKFTGQRLESSFGLYFYNARWYDASAGRFVSADSVIPNNGYGNGDSRRIQIMLIVDYHETNLLTQLNDLNYRNTLNPAFAGRNEEKDFDPLNPSPTEIDQTKRDNRDAYLYERNEEPLIDFNKPNNPWKAQDNIQQNETNRKNIGAQSLDLLPTRLNSMNLDRYAYTSNCPTKYTDPSGHCNIGKAIAGGFIAGIGLIPFSLGAATLLMGTAKIASAPLTGPFAFLPVVEGWKGIAVGGIMMGSGGGIIVIGGIYIYQSGCIQEIISDVSD